MQDADCKTIVRMREEVPSYSPSCFMVVRGFQVVECWYLEGSTLKTSLRAFFDVQEGNELCIKSAVMNQSSVKRGSRSVSLSSIQCIIHAAKRICSMQISDQALYVCLS